LSGESAPGTAFAAHGQTLAVHDSQGTIQASTAVLSSLGYSGEYFDTSAQQQYLRASFSNPANVRVTRLDPFAGNMRDPQSLHKYAYVHGDPVQGVDPTGLSGLFYLFHAANSIPIGLTQFQLASSFTRIESARIKASSTGSTDPSAKDKLPLRWWHFFWNGTEPTMVVQDVDNVGTLSIVLRSGRKITMDYREHYVEAWTNPGKATNAINRVTDQHQQRPPGKVLETILGGNFFVSPRTPWAPTYRDPNGTLDVVESWTWDATVEFKLATVPSQQPFGKFFHNRITTSVRVTDSVGGNKTSTAPISALSGPGAPWLQFPQGKFTQAVDTYSSSFRYGANTATATGVHGDYK
jgi:RHS repeat-associated protein